MITEIDAFKEMLYEDDAALVKINCLYHAYGVGGKVIGFFKQVDEENNLTALMSVAGGNVNLWQKNGDLDEIKSYLSFIGATNVFTSEKTAQKLSLSSKKPCFLMKVRQNVLNKDCVIGEDTPRRILEILKTGLVIENDDEFLSDITYRLYHSAAGFALSDKGAGLVFKSKVCSIIGGLAVLPEFRRSGGFGSELLNVLREQSKNANFFVCCEEKNIGFYNKNGFCVVQKAGDFGVRV